MAVTSINLISNDNKKGKLHQIVEVFYEANSTDDSIALEKTISSFSSVLNNIVLVFITTYTFGLIWYRLSDFILPTYVTSLSGEPEERYWVVKFGLRNPSTVDEPDLMPVFSRLAICMYYMLTTLSTVGYGDFYPFSISEKLVSVLIMVICGMIFSVLLGSLIEAFSPQIDDPIQAKRDKLNQWFGVIRKLRQQPGCEGKNVQSELLIEIEKHFNYYWEHDRVSVIMDKPQYFDSIPFKIQSHIMCNFAFEEILTKPGFQKFFQAGKDFDNRFIYEISFGFMPREFRNTPEDRWIYEEETDVTEIYFIMRGNWGIGFNSFQKDGLEYLDDEMIGTTDMSEKGIILARKAETKVSILGDYYVLASKRSEFSFVTLSGCSGYALSKQFINKKLLPQFPGLLAEMLGEAFCRYIKEFRKPCNATRAKIIASLNSRNQYSKIQLGETVVQREKVSFVRTPSQVILNNKSIAKAIETDKYQQMLVYKDLLDQLNDEADQASRVSAAIKQTTNQKLVNIENQVVESEQLLLDEIFDLVGDKGINFQNSSEDLSGDYKSESNQSF